MKSGDTLGSAIRCQWALTDEITFLNHGSFGACPRPVLNAQQEIRRQMESQPVRFFQRDAPALIDDARRKVAQFLGSTPEDLVFVNNATSGVNGVLRSFPWVSGDEILVIDHGYPACLKTVSYVNQRWNTSSTVAKLPWPAPSVEGIIDAVMMSVSPRTRVALIDHITSPTGLILPVETLVPMLEKLGISVLVDGAHAPGMVPLDLNALGASWYVGNFHKWVCAPKGAGFLWTRRDQQRHTHPTVISHGFQPTGPFSYHREFDWTGTDDISPWLCVPIAIDWMSDLHPQGWTGIMKRNHRLALDGRKILHDARGIEPSIPDEMIGSLALLPMPDTPGEPYQLPMNESPAQKALWDAHRIEVPIFPWPAHPEQVLRISATVYNDLEDYQILAHALGELHPC